MVFKLQNITSRPKDIVLQWCRIFKLKDDRTNMYEEKRDTKNCGTLNL